MHAEDLDMQLATEEHLDLVIDLLEGACAWLEGRGLAYWPCGMLRRNPEIIGKRIRERTVYVAYFQGEAIGTITLRWDDEKVWGKRPEDAAYVAGLASARAVSGNQIGKAMLDCAEHQARQKNRHFLRLDCTAKSPGLLKYYRDLGYKQVGERIMTDIDRRALFEKEIRPA